MSCPPVQVLHLLLFLFSIAPSIAVPYSAMCGHFFGDSQGEVEEVTEDDIQLLLNATGISNGTELTFSWSVFGFSRSESFGTYLSIDCSHLEAPLVNFEGSAIGRVSLISPPVYNCTVLTCFKIPPLEVFYYHVFGPYESQKNTEKVSSDPLPSSTSVTTDGTSSVYSSVSYSTFLEDDEFEDFYSTTFSISSPSTSIPLDDPTTTTTSIKNTLASIDRVTKEVSSSASYSSVSSDGVQSTISSRLASSVSTVIPIESGSVQGSGNETQDYTNQVVFAVVSSIILTTTLIVCGMVAWTTARKCLSRKKIAKEIQENLGKTELLLVHVTPSPSLYTIISPLQTFNGSYTDTSNDSKSDIKDTTTSSSSSVTPSPPVSPTSSDNLFTSKTDSFISHRISTKPVNNSMSTDTLSSYDSCSIEVTETAALKRHLPASTAQPTALPPVELLQLELEPGHTSSSSDWSSSGSCITYYKVFERRRDRVEGEVDVSGDKSCSTFSDRDDDHHHHRYSLLDHFSSSQTTGHTYIQDCNSFNSSCS